MIICCVFRTAESFLYLSTKILDLKSDFNKYMTYLLTLNNNIYLVIVVVGVQKVVEFGLQAGVKVHGSL